MRKPERVENQRGLQRLGEEIEAFACATGTLARINAFIRAARRLRTVAARATGVSFRSEQPEKDICYVLEWVVNGNLWTQMWQAERMLLAGTKPDQTREIVRKFPMYLQEMRRAYPRLVNVTAAREARARASANMYRSWAHTVPLDPGRRGPRVDLTIQPIEDGLIDREERSLRVDIGGLERAKARKLKETIAALPGVSAVHMDLGRDGWHFIAKCSIRTVLTAEELTRLLSDGLPGMSLATIRVKESTIQAANLQPSDRQEQT